MILITCHLSLIPSTAQRLVVTRPTVDVGRTGYEIPVTASFELRNKGLRRLVIESVEPDCGCTSVDYPREVGVGDKCTIRLTYDARQLGHFYKMVTIRSNGSKKPVCLTMKGVVLRELEDYTGNYPFAMGSLLLDKDGLEYDDVSKGDTPRQEIHIMNNSSEVMTPRLMHLPTWLSATITPETLQPGKSGTVAVSLESSNLRNFGFTQTQVFLAQQLGEKVSADKAIDVSVILLPDLKDYDAVSHALAPQLQISTTDIDFSGKPQSSKLKAQTSKFKVQSSKIKAEVMLANTGKTTLRISSMQMSTGGMKVTLGKRELAPGETTTLKITGFLDELHKLKTRPRILMITNDPDHPKVLINIHL